ncbi:MAG: transcription termination/antitermination NusG family protein [Syntrophales bacterium]|nr:transcription termination/antitermination NusG family protein [Syntrophales bacterium]MDD5233312.1 transcription termination/antitermination NusG family protein [Syntrophales bacterium]MDD5531170.1 transcription termination/antitermination NusG family protein [Syntrophales bacterium]HPL62300.1 transcription termination/antitermination NusG family protein [Syntrophales bacterium]
MASWYVIQTKPRKEGSASIYLAGKGIETFNPLMEAVVVRSGKQIRKRKPVFPGYIFGRFDVDQSYALVHWGKGVKKVLGQGGRPTPVSDSVVETIRSRMDGNSVVRRAYRLRPKDNVRIKTGPMKDLIGILERWVSDSERVRVLLKLIGYHPAVELHYSMVEKVS